MIRVAFNIHLILQRRVVCDESFPMTDVKRECVTDVKRECNEPNLAWDTDTDCC